MKCVLLLFLLNDRIGLLYLTLDRNVGNSHTGAGGAGAGAGGAGAGAGAAGAGAAGAGAGA